MELAVGLFLMERRPVARRGCKCFADAPENSGNGYLDISGHQSGVTVGSIEGDGYIFMGANDLTVGTNNMNTVFSGVIFNNGQQRFAGQGRQWCTHFANQLLHRGHGRSHSRKRLNHQARLYRGSGRNRISSGRRRSATAGRIWRSNERRSTSTPRVCGSWNSARAGPPSWNALGNISTRAFVQTGDNVMIGGFIVQRDGTKMVIIRAIGPELTQYGIPNPLSNPTLELHDGTGALIASNDNWQTHNNRRDYHQRPSSATSRTAATRPADGRESAIIAVPATR